MREHTRTAPVAYASLEPWQRSIGEIFAESAARQPEAVYVVDGGVRADRATMARAAATVRDALLAAGVRAGDVVSMQLSNTWCTIAAMHGAWAMGAVVNPITTIYRGSELGAIFGSAAPAAVLVASTARGVDFVAQARDAVAAAGISAVVLDIDEILPAPPAAAGPLAEPAHPLAVSPVSPTDVALLMFTSGTTGTPKGVLHSHQTLLYEAASIGEVFGLDGEAVFMPSPLAHVTGLLYGVLMPLLTHGSVSLLDRWDADVAADLIEHDGCAFTVAATPFLRGLSDSYARRGTPSSLRAFVCGGADIPPTLVAEAEQTMGLRVSRTYGSTEMPTLCIVRPDDAGPDRLTSEGHLIGEADARLADDGELEVRGPELFVGYLDPRDDEPAFTNDGWFRTGDLASITPDGLITITGRRKDLIVRGGENISAKEVEDLLLTHEAILDVAMIGVPDPLMGERACAVVVLRPGAELRLADLTAHLDRRSIARQKYPELLWKVDAFPRTVSGKVQKFVLRQQAAAASAAGALERR
ncbi:AMP-binding protein [Herbiconiux daphne]|uniref:AMP-binding protein n=1 Tax=Herbiconiux daphne TaxID=2970914 RepID=A0ABT2H5F9_9MICO|nr:AMP-binding protein [Herbiconiux daphne]MCS5735162.1 AMP-binding protein [Herbiconiux daphne]